jgi:hypothetical protein
MEFETGVMVDGDGFPGLEHRETRATRQEPAPAVKLTILGSFPLESCGWLVGFLVGIRHDKSTS